jgi:hypothetical protein
MPGSLHDGLPHFHDRITLKGQLRHGDIGGLFVQARVVLNPAHFSVRIGRSLAHPFG